MDETKKKTKAKRIVTDSFGNDYQLIGKLGEGGQGVVCETNHPNVLVKIAQGRSKEQQQRWIQHIEWLMLQPLDELCIARPQALITKPQAGYVMELMDGLEPISDLFERVQEHGATAYYETGGLLRRLQLLNKLAFTLASLHARGLVYGDLSLENIYVSKDIKFSEVWLIDCDNICFESQGAIYTEGYGAPELVTGKSGINTLTDCWSFAVIAYQLLTANHPFKGDCVNEGEPELEEQALSGELPWINHPDDNMNRCENGLNHEIVISSGLFKLFDQCFREGLGEPFKRPAISAWVDALLKACSVIINCDNSECSSSFFYNPVQVCPFCEQEMTHKAMLLREYYWLPNDEALKKPNGDYDNWINTGRAKILQSAPIELVHHIPASYLLIHQNPVCSLSLADNGLSIEPFTEKVALGKEQDTPPIFIRKKAKLNNDKKKGINALLHLGELTKAHPVWIFKW